MPQSLVIAMESCEACSNMISSQKGLLSDNQEAKRKLTSDTKEVEMQCKIGETNFTVPLRLSESLKRDTNLGSEADPTILPSCSSNIKMKNDPSMVSHEKPPCFLSFPVSERVSHFFRGNSWQ